MTDREVIEAMLKRAGIEYETKADSINVYRGYIGFVVGFEFNPDGSLKDVGAWE